MNGKASGYRTTLAGFACETANLDTTLDFHQILAQKENVNRLPSLDEFVVNSEVGDVKTAISGDVWHIVSV